MLAELSVLRAQNMALRKCIDNKCVPGCSTSSSASLGDFKRDLGRDEGSSRDTLLKAWDVDKKATIIARTDDIALKKLQLECGELKASLFTRDAQVCNLRFEVEAHSNVAKRLKRKVNSLCFSKSGMGTKCKTILKLFSTKELNKIVSKLQCKVQHQQLEIEQIQLCSGIGAAGYSQLLRK